MFLRMAEVLLPALLLLWPDRSHRPDGSHGTERNYRGDRGYRGGLFRKGDYL